jgi:outer membrane protein assembly factor BamB
MSLRARRLLTSAVAVAALTATGAYAAGAAPWPQGGHDAALSRANAGDTSLTAATIGRAQYLRSIVAAPQPGGNDSACTAGVQAEPLVVGNTVFAVLEHRLTAHDARTGALRWSVTLDLDPEVSRYVGPAYAGGRVLLATMVDACVSEDPGGSLRSYDAATGALQWSSGTGGPISALRVSGTTVVAAGSSPGSGATVAALNLADGTIRWSKTDLCGEYPSRVVVVAGRVIYGACDESGVNPTLVARALATGARAWTKPGAWSVQRGDSDNPSGPHHIYVGSSAGLVDVNPANGATRYTIPGPGVRSLAVDATRVYATCPAGVCAYLRATGAPTWSAAAPESLDALTVGSGIVVLPDGRVLRAGDGVELRDLWTAPDAQWMSLGDGYLTSVTDTRLIDLFGLPGR